MTALQHTPLDATQPNATPPFPALQFVTKPKLTTAEIAYYFDRAEQTCRIWAMRENGPLRPVRICGRLAWATSDAKRILLGDA